MRGEGANKHSESTKKIGGWWSWQLIRVFVNVSDKEKFGEIYAELAAHNGDIFSSSCTGVILTLTTACISLESQQAFGVSSNMLRY